MFLLELVFIDLVKVVKLLKIAKQKSFELFRNSNTKPTRRFDPQILLILNMNIYYVAIAASSGITRPHIMRDESSLTNP